MTIYPPQIQQQLRDYHVFLDTNVFIYASKDKSFFDFLTSLNNDYGCVFVTIPSVVFEYTNGSSTAQQYNERMSFLNSLAQSVDSMRFVNDIQDFYIVMSKVNDQNKSYTDYLLAACLYNYRHAKVALITADLKAFPSFFPRTHILAVEREKEIKNFGVYEFSTDDYLKAAQKTLKELAK